MARTRFAHILSTPLLILVFGLVCLSESYGCDDSPALEGSGFQLINLVDDIGRFQDVSRHYPQSMQAGAFKAYFADKFPGFYDADRLPHLSAADYDRSIIDALESFPAMGAIWQRIASGLAHDFEPAIVSFRRSFPGAGPVGTVYLVHSLGELDGGTRQIEGKEVLIFGVDVIALVHDFDDETPFIHHELFHVYHSKHLGPCDALWCAVWSEGLAVAAALRLNPDATDAELLLTRPEPLREAVEANLSKALTTVRRLSASEKSDVYEAVLGSRRLAPSLPPRFGYYVGYLLANEALKSRSLAALAEMPATTSEKLFYEVLSNLIERS